MAINKMHQTPDGLKKCSAEIACEYGASEKQHVFMDTSINAPVLNPASPEQKKLNSKSVEDLKAAHSDNESVQKSYGEYQKNSAEYDAVVEKLMKKHPAPKQGFSQQLENVTEGNESVSVFNINAPSTDFIKNVSDKEKSEHALAWLKKKKSEDQVRAHVSAAHVQA